MDRIWGSNVSQQPPAISDDAPVGYPTDGSSSGGVSATVPTAAWYYLITEEIANAILGAGLKLNRHNLSQLNESIELRIKKLSTNVDSLIENLTTKIQQVETTPPGAVMAFARDSAPSSAWLVCDGRAVSRDTYKNLFAAIGTRFGRGNGTTTFNVPDLRGVFVRGHDTGRGLDPGRQFGSYQQDALGRHIHDIWASNWQTGGGRGGTGYWAHDYKWGSTEPTGGDETRPKNIALLYCIHI